MVVEEAVSAGHRTFIINGDIECANGYYPQIGDIPGSGIVEDAGFGEQVHNCNECSKLCSDRDDCLSYECSKTE